MATFQCDDMSKLKVICFDYDDTLFHHGYYEGGGRSRQLFLDFTSSIQKILHTLRHKCRIKVAMVSFNPCVEQYCKQHGYEYDYCASLTVRNKVPMVQEVIDHFEIKNPASEMLFVDDLMENCLAVFRALKVPYLWVDANTGVTVQLLTQKIKDLHVALHVESKKVRNPYTNRCITVHGPTWKKLETKYGRAKVSQYKQCD